MNGGAPTPLYSATGKSSQPGRSEPDTSRLTGSFYEACGRIRELEGSSILEAQLFEYGDISDRLGKVVRRLLKVQVRGEQW